MKNFEKYQTADGRLSAWNRHCRDVRECSLCKLKDVFFKRTVRSDCAFAWLDLEAEEEKPLPCPFCGSEMGWAEINSCSRYELQCKGCDYVSGGNGVYDEWKAIAAHNRVAKAVMDAKAKEGL